MKSLILHSLDNSPQKSTTAMTVTQSQVEGAEHDPTRSYLNNCSNTHLIYNSALLTHIRKRKFHIVVHGVNSNGSPLAVTEGRSRCFGALTYHLKVRANLISQPTLVDMGCKFSYSTINEEIDPDSYTIIDPSHCKKMRQFTKREEAFGKDAIKFIIKPRTPLN